MGGFPARRVFVAFLLLAGLCYFGFLKPDSNDTQAADLVVRQALGSTTASSALALLRADFPEPFLPTVKGVNPEPLASVLERYQADSRPKSRKVDLLEEFLKENPDDPWSPSVRVNLGLYYQNTGRFTRTLEHLERAWIELKDSEDTRLKALADHAFGAYTQTLANLGRMKELESLLRSVEGRSFSGRATELVAASKEGLYTMRTSPEYSFWCGPAALRRIGKRSGSWRQEDDDILRACPSTFRGTSLLRNRTLSREVGLNYQMAYREPGSRIITPAVVHWKAGHFAAVFESEAGIYSVEDDTAGFQRDEVKMTKGTMDEEASGYFLIPPGPLPSGWRSVSEEEGKAVWGRGYVGFEFDGDATGDDDVIVGPPGSDTGASSRGWSDGDGDDGGGPGGGGGGGGEPCDLEEPLTNWSAHAMVVSLRLVDTPVGLSPAAFSVPFRVTYAQREMGQPAVFDYSNLGPKWTSNWTSFITDKRDENGKVRLYKVGGGTDEYTFTTSTVRSDRGPYSQAFLNDTGQGFILDWPNGSHDHYTKFIGSRYHLTKRTSPQGNDTLLEYDELGRLSQIIDPSGRVMSLSYGLSGDPLKITKVTDPFGRSANFAYTDDGHLGSITDVIGLTSSFQYGTDDFVNILTTPYGTTTFSYADGKLDFDDSDVEHRILEITDAEGRKHRVENAERGIHASIVAPSPALEKSDTPVALTTSNNTTGLYPVNVSVPYSESEVPSGIPVLPEYQDGRNTFYWAPHQLDENPDTSKATIYHFLYLSEPGNAFRAKSRVLESVKRPLQNRIWYAYPGNTTDPGYFRGDSKPTHVARLLSDGTTQLWRYQYNTMGNVTQKIDPAGRIFDYIYAPNGIDLLNVVRDGQTLFGATYDSRHNVLTFTGADGQASQYSYDSRGLLQTALNPLGELSTFTYTPEGNIATVSGPLGVMASFERDSAERISSATDSEGYIVQVSYDTADRPLSVTYPDGTQDTLVYNRLDLVRTEDRNERMTQTSYDAVRRLTSITDGNGGNTVLTYGSYSVPTSLTDPEGNVTLFQYDLQQRLVRKQYADGAAQAMTYEQCAGRLRSVTDALGQSKLYTYFIDNQLKQIQYAGDTPTVSFTNDTFLPRPTSMTDGLGTHTMAYGPVGSPGANRLIGITGPFGDQASFTYDAAGRVAGQTVNGEVESAVFDQLWRPTSVTNALDTFGMAYLGKTGQVTEMISSLGPTVQHTYSPNNLDRRLSRIKNLGQSGQVLSQFDYTYDPVGQITSLVQTHGRNCSTGDGDGDSDDNDDGNDRCECKGKKGCKNHKKDKHDKKDKREKHHGKDKHDKKDQHEKGKHRGKNEHHRPDYRSSPGQIFSLLWQVHAVLRDVWGFGHEDWDWSWYDEDDLENGGDDDSADDASAGDTVETLQFSYDNLSQLVGVNLNGNPYAGYTFDRAGNLTGLTLNGGNTTFTYNSLNQVTSPGTPTFDAKGQAGLDAQGRSFEWDEQGRVTAIVQGNRRSEFGYDGLSRRSIIREIVDGQIESKKLYWWLGGSIVCERDGLQTGYPITKRYFGQGVLRTASLGPGDSTKLFYTTDHLGSVRQLVDENGEVVADYRYSIYGERTKVCGDLDSDFGFAGLFHHEPSGLDLATYRLYDAQQRRFISRDPLGEGVDYNLYRYAGNNPVNVVDPAGGYPVWMGETPPSDPQAVARAQAAYGQPVKAPKGGIPLSPLGETIYEYHPGIQSVEAVGDFYEKASTGTLTSDDAWEIIGDYVLGKFIKCKKKRKGNRGRFKRGADDQLQFEEINEAQSRLRKGKRDGIIIDSTEKSQQRERNSLKRIQDYDDAVDEFGYE